jgi:GNAT superfamily N-acetyltransferase
VAEVDRDLLRRWQERAQERASGFVLDFWDGPYPEEDLLAFTGLINQAMSDAPRDSLEMPNPHWTPEQIREFEAATFAAGKQRWVAHVRDNKSSGIFAGYTAIFWHPNRPHIVDQGDTAVSPGFRNRGLGRWLKAAMLERLIRERPQVKFVRTGNANSNAPMLRINRELGFRPYLTKCRWQVETERLECYLERPATS